MKMTERQRYDLARYMYQRRKANQFTQRELAERVQVSFTYISRIETEGLVMRPSLHFLKRCMAIFEDPEAETLGRLGIIDTKALENLAQRKRAIAILLNRMVMNGTGCRDANEGT